MVHGVPIGRVTGYDMTTERAAIELTDGGLEQGASLLVRGPQGTVTVEGARLFEARDRGELETASAGQVVLVGVPERVRPGDAVHRLAEPDGA